MLITKRQAILTLLAGILLGPLSQAVAQNQGDPRSVVVEKIRNDHASFMVRVSVDHKDHIYNGGDVMKVAVVSEKPGYLYLFYCDANKKLSVLFPNRIQKDNRIPAGKVVAVPHADSNFRLRVTAPFGKEVLKAVVTKSPLNAFELDSLTKGDVTPIDVEDLVKAVEVESRERPSGWAEHGLQITTMATGQRAQSEHRRIGIFIGISNYKSDRVNDLTICHADAEKMAQVMKRHCQLDDVIQLTETQATLANIEKAIRKTAKQRTRPGDEIFIFWSGHGARISDDNGDEKDGYDELLVPYDAKLDDLATIRKTTLLDDMFGRWIQDLDGRKVVVILDTCHSGGQNNNEKGLTFGASPRGAAFDFFDGEMNRAKDIGQKETALLASSKAAEISFERKEGDLSAMTYFLVQQLANGSDRISLADAFKYLSDNVPSYVEGRFPGTTQTPVLVDNTSPPLYLRR